MSQDIDKNISQLVQEAEDLKEVSYQSPKFDLWKRRAKGFIQENYGDEFVEMLRRALSWGQIVTHGQGQRMHIEALDRAIVLLTSLKDEAVIEKPSKLEESTSKKDAIAINKLHPHIISKCSSLFEKGEYPEAVEKGFKIVRDRLRELTGYETGSEAFGKVKLHVKGAVAPHVDEDFNQGIKFLTMAIDRFRNEKSHTSDGNINDPDRAYEYLTLCSLAMHLLENAEILP